jgi:hypothetical protein
MIGDCEVLVLCLPSCEGLCSYMVLSNKDIMRIRDSKMNFEVGFQTKNQKVKYVSLWAPSNSKIESFGFNMKDHWEMRMVVTKLGCCNYGCH